MMPLVVRIFAAVYPSEATKVAVELGMVFGMKTIHFMHEHSLAGLEH